MGASFRGIDFGELLSPEVRAKHKHTTYDLIANIVHDGEPGTEKGQYKVQILHKVSQRRWLDPYMYLGIEYHIKGHNGLSLCVET